MKFIYLNTTLLMCLLALSACSGNSTDKISASQKTSKSIHSHYAKPAAPINFSHNYTGFSEVGESDEFSITITSQRSGTLNTSISSNADILVNTTANSSKFLAAGESIEVPISVNLPSSGKYHITVNSSINIDGHLQHKVFAIAVTSTDLKNASGSKKVSPSIIILPSVETAR